MFYKPKYFQLEELIDPVTFKDYGQQAWEFLDDRLLVTIDLLREAFGPAIINNWNTGGKFQWSGLRTPRCTEGARMSQHRFGRAVDMKFTNISAEEVRTAIKSDPVWKARINCIENNVAWLHVDFRNCDSIKWINP